MADPRFFRNHGPFTLGDAAAKLGIALPGGANAAAVIADLASLDGAGPQHIAFFSGVREQREVFARSRAGFCLVPVGDVDALATRLQGLQQDDARAARLARDNAARMEREGSRDAQMDRADALYRRLLART